MSVGLYDVNVTPHFLFGFFSTSGGRRGPGAEGHRAGDGPGQCVTGQGHPRTETQQERHCECDHGEQERGEGGGGRVWEKESWRVEAGRAGKQNNES